MSGVDYIAYTILLTIWTTGMSILSMCNAYHLIIGAIGEKIYLTLDIKTPVEWYIFTFLVALVMHLGPIYIMIDSGSGTFGDAAGRYVALIYALSIFMLMGAVNWVYKVYVFIHRNEYLDFAAMVKPMTAKDPEPSAEEGKSLHTVHLALFCINAIGFIALMVGSIIYVYILSSAMLNVATSLLLASCVIICFTALVTFMDNDLALDIKSIQRVQGLQRGEAVHDVVTATGFLVRDYAVKISDPKVIQKIKECGSQTGTVKGCTGQAIPKNTMLGTVFSIARESLNEPHKPLVIRTIAKDTFVMPAHIASVLDHLINESAGDVLKLPPVSSTGRRMVEHRYNKSAEIAGDTVLNPYYGKHTVSTNLIRVALIRDLDMISEGYFLFLEDIWGLSDGVGIHMKFARSIIIPFVFYTFAFYIAFMQNTLYGIIAWIITVVPPFWGALNGTFSQFWDMFIYTFMIGWSSITLVKLIVPSGDPTYLYSNAVWNNTDVANTVCTASCTNIVESTTYYWACIITFIVSSLSCLYELTRLAYRKGFNIINKIRGDNKNT